ncbi:hypothetical protein SNEBB_006247 [Seison nebaliae]|nr:hypothetical protein SNEBB_006247 [Seison nebaliae]
MEYRNNPKTNREKIPYRGQMAKKGEDGGAERSFIEWTRSSPPLSVPVDSFAKLEVVLTKPKVGTLFIRTTVDRLREYWTAKFDGFFESWSTYLLQMLICRHDRIKSGLCYRGLSEFPKK